MAFWGRTLFTAGLLWIRSLYDSLLTEASNLEAKNFQSYSTTKYCRNRMDLIVTYKILNGAVLVDKEYFFTMNTSYSTRFNGYKIYKKFNRTALR